MPRRLYACLPIFVALGLALPAPVRAAPRCDSVFANPDGTTRTRPLQDRLAMLGELQKNLALKVDRARLNNDPALPLLGRLYNGPVRLLLPAPAPRLRSDVGGIFEKIWHDPTAALTHQEISLLRRHDALKLARAQQSFLRDHPAWRRTRLGLDHAKTFLTMLVAGLALHQTVDSMDDVHDFEEYVRRPDFVDGQPIIHLLIETAPFPHTALRVGAQVYSYGVTHMTSGSVAEYFANPPDPVPTTEEEKDLHARMLRQVRKSGITDRSVRFIEIKLPKDQALALRRDLEMQTGKRYNNVTGVNDCATMIARALEKHSGLKTPPLLDAYPTTAGIYLTARRLLGDSRVGRSGIVLTKRDHSGRHLARNYFIAKLEAAAFVASAAYQAPQRALIELEDMPLQWWDAETLTEIEDWRQKIRADLRADLGVDDLLKAPLRASDPARFARDLDAMLAPSYREAREVLNSQRAEFYDLVIAQTKVETLDRLRVELLAQP